MSDIAESLGSQIQSGMRWSVARQVVTGIIGTLGAVVYTRLITPEDLGAATLAILVFTALILLINAPIRDAIVYYQDETEEVASAAFWVLLVLSISACLLVLLLADAFAQFYESELAAPLTRAITLAAFLRALDVVPASVLIKQMQFQALELLRGANFILLAIGWVVFAVLGYGAWSLVLPQIVSASVITVATWWVARFWPKLPRRKYLAAVIRFGRSVFGGKLLLYLTRNFDNAVVGRLGEAALGFYGVGENQAEFAAITVAEAFGQVGLAALAKLQRQLDAFRMTFLRLLRLMATFGTPAQVGAYVVADVAFLVIFGEQWLPAVPVFRAFLIFNLFNTLAELCDAATSAAGRPEMRLRVNLIQLPFFAAATLWAMNQYGTILAVAVLLSTVRVVFTFGYIVWTLRLVQANFREFRWALLPSTIAGFGMGVVCLLLRNYFLDNWLMMRFPDPLAAATINLTVTVTLGSLLFLGLLLLVARKSTVEVIGEYYHMIVPTSIQQQSTVLRWLGQRLPEAHWLS